MSFLNAFNEIDPRSQRLQRPATYLQFHLLVSDMNVFVLKIRLFLVFYKKRAKCGNLLIRLAV